MLRILVVTTAHDYKHECIDAATNRVKQLALSHDIGCDVCADVAQYFNDSNTLKSYDLIVFNNNSGEVFNEQQKAVFEEFVSSGKALLGIHAATAAFLSGEDASGAQEMETTYPFFADAWGASFTDHPPLQDGIVKTNQSVCDNLQLKLPISYATNDEWYNFDRNVYDNESITVVAEADISSIGGSKMQDRHPLIWYHEPYGTRVFYTALGHHPKAYDTDETIINVLDAGIKWCLKL
eukprot:TRINITY_DN6630_c0_g1_i1.p1 TRINITY_DN6630_c0_g1~~TRINITY_DN6630_c0_g1_i1.p1  ORF type:complete len:237 (+),score=61.91 TRINITY_DN6630_c0_g1_i1:268-978(+)